MKIDEVFIAHPHLDHTGGLSDFLKVRPVKVYMPYSCTMYDDAANVIKIDEKLKIHENIYSTGEL